MKYNASIRLTEILKIIPPELSKISEEEFSMKVNSDKWSKKEILGHLIDSAANNHHRFIRAQYQNSPTIIYDQNKWNELNHYQLLESKHIIQFWTIYNQHLLEVIKRIPAENLLRQCNVSSENKVTLQFLIDDYVEHLQHHLKQITAYNF